VIPAGIVLYNPNVNLLDKLLTVLEFRQRRLFIFINGSVEAPLEQRLSRLSNAHVFHSEVNHGLATGLNKIVAAAKQEGFEQVMLFDQDSTLDRDVPERLARRFKEIESRSISLAVLGPRLVPPENEGYRPLRYKYRSDSLSIPNLCVDFIPTSGSLISIAAWKHIGPFRDDFFVDGIDVEWCYRAWHHAYKCILADDIKMYHRWGLPQKSNDRNQPQIMRQSELRTYYYLRNAVYSLRLPHIPLRSKAPQVVRLTAQSMLFASSRRFKSTAFRLIWRAISAGLSGHLGPAPDDLATR
jgi:rhamnosyltransferase